MYHQLARVFEIICDDNDVGIFLVKIFNRNLAIKQTASEMLTDLSKIHCAGRLFFAGKIVSSWRPLDDSNRSQSRTTPAVYGAENLNPIHHLVKSLSALIGRVFARPLICGLVDRKSGHSGVTQLIFASIIRAGSRADTLRCQSDAANWQRLSAPDPRWLVR